MDIQHPESDRPVLTEKKKLIHSLIFPSFFILLLWIIKLIEYESGWELYWLGIYPMKLKGILGIITSPLIHADFRHLLNNSIPLFVLSVGLFYLYRPIPYRIFFLIYILSGICVWIGARPAYHIGSSGLIYGIAAFLFFSGIIRRDIRLMAISMLIVFLYGSMVWGIFPLQPLISWESHLWGSMAGVVLAFFYRKYGPQPVTYPWENEEDEETDDESSEVKEAEETDKPE